MKKGVVLLLSVFLMVSGTVLASEPQENQGILGNLDIKMSGEINVQAKYQESFITPFDNPDWGWTVKSGANHREDQNIRALGSLNFYFGEPGKTKFFGGVQMLFDANDPDTDTGEENEPNFETQNAAIMYRPFEKNGGRPLGITLGIQSIPQTMNGYYSNLFKGDFDNDFAANLASGLISMPAVTLDFHINPDTGIGATLAKGVSYISEAAAYVNPDTATSAAFWFEGKHHGFGINGAYQRVKGNRGSTSPVETNNDNIYYEYSNKGYYHNLFNSLVSYTFDLSKLDIKPYLGYQAMWGDETPLPDYSNIDEKNYGFQYAGYGPREFEGNLKTAGVTITTELFNKPNKFSFEFTKVYVPDFDGISTLKKGSVDQLGRQLLEDEEYRTEINAMIEDVLNTSGVFPEGFDYAGLWPMTPIAGSSKSIYHFADIDFIFCFEHTIELSKNITLGTFAYSLKAKDDSTLGNDSYIRNQLMKGFTNKLREMGFDETSASDNAKIIFDKMDATTMTDENGNALKDHEGNTIDAIQYVINDTKPAEWTDTYSIGLYISYTF